MRPIDPLLFQPPPGNTRWGGYENCLSFWFYCQNLVSVSVRTATYVVKIEQRIFWYSSQNSEPPCTTQLLQRPKSDLKFGWFLEFVRGFEPQNLDSTTPQKMVIWNVPGDQKVLEFWFELPVECGLRVVSIFAQIVLTANSVCVLPCNLGGSHCLRCVVLQRCAHYSRANLRRVGVPPAPSAPAGPGVGWSGCADSSLRLYASAREGKILGGACKK